MPAAHSEELGSHFLWFQLKRIGLFPEKFEPNQPGLRHLQGSGSADFEGYLRQAQTYWDAAQHVKGSASSLLHYYSFLQLAKAELLTTGNEAGAKFIHHGLSVRRGKTSSIRDDQLFVQDGVFRQLVNKRTDLDLPKKFAMNVMDLLSLIPEIGLEMGDLGPTRLGSVFGYHSIAIDERGAWPLVLLVTAGRDYEGEAVFKNLKSRFEEIALTDLVEWRSIFELNTRGLGQGLQLFQGQRIEGVSGADYASLALAAEELVNAVSLSVRPPGRSGSDFILTPTLTETESVTLPLDLIRYAVIFYLSSLVRYSPATLDPRTNASQAFLMDSVSHEIPIHLLADSLNGITGTYAHFSPRGLRH